MTRFKHFLLVVFALLMLRSSSCLADAPSQPKKIATDVLRQLKEQCDNPEISNQSARMSYLSTTERLRIDYIEDLRALAAEGIDATRRELLAAEGEYKKMLIITLAALGDKVFVSQAVQLMLQAEEPAVRVCAAFELRKLKDKELIESFKQALSDPFKRIDGACTRQDDEMIYPVRLIALHALERLDASP